MSNYSQLIKYLLMCFIIGAAPLKADGRSAVRIAVNQLGYFPGCGKIAAVEGNAETFSLYSLEKEKIVFSGRLTAPRYWPAAGDSIRFADFSAVEAPGGYCLVVNGRKSFEFLISSKVYSRISAAAAKSFYYQRCSVSLPEKFAGKWRRKEGVPDTAVIIHPSASDKFRPEGSRISAPGGWFDAGDYNKYTVNAGVTVVTLMYAYELFPEYFENLTLNIPESGNNIPDILDEVLWELRWLLRMQHPAEGSVYHKLTFASFQPVVMPEGIKGNRYIVGKSTAAALDFAAAMAHASVLFKDRAKLLPDFADSCLIAAERAWQWAVHNPGIYFNNPPDIDTGEYGDRDLRDEFFWAGMELFLATGDTAYLKDINPEEEIKVDSLYWKHVTNFGIFSWLADKNSRRLNSEYSRKFERIFKKAADDIVNKYRVSPYLISNGIFKWGSNSNVLNQTVILLAAYRFYGERKYIDAAIANTDYILGRNPLNMCYVTGYGKKSPRRIHHRISAADGIPEPVPGFVVGGPNPEFLIDVGKENYPSLLPAECYLDSWDSYSTNEVAVNWNAPLVFVLSALDFYARENLDECRK
jgi:endoglucanase